MTGPELTEEDVFENDLDPMEAIRAIRREEGVAEEDLPEHSTDISDVNDVLDRDTAADKAKTVEDEEELAELDTSTENKETEDKDDPSEDEKAASAAAEAADAAILAADQAADKRDGIKTETSDELESKKAEKEVEKEVEKDTDTSTIRKFRANGQDFEFTEKEILEQFEVVFGQSMNYTQKMQKIAPYRKMISALEEEGITQDSLNLAIDALKGDKGAIKKLMENNKIDAYDLTAEGEEATTYAPKVYGKDEVLLEIEEITSRLQGDKEFAITTNVIDEQWDNESRQVIAKNPNLITGLHNDIKTGLYDKVAPAAMKMKVLDGNTKSDIEYYMLAGENLRVSMEQEAKIATGQKEVDKLNETAQGAEEKFDKASSEAKRKRSASSTGTRADRRGVIDFLDDDDEAYDAWYKRIHANK